MQTIEQALRAASVDIVPEFIGKLLRNGTHWFYGRAIETPEGILYCAHFADFRSGDGTHYWQSQEKLSPEAAANMDAFLQEARSREQAEREATYEAVALELSQLLPQYIQGIESPYFVKKGVSQIEGHVVNNNCFINMANNRETVVPLRDVNGKLWSCIRISAEGQKSLEPGGRKRGCFHTIGLAVNSPLPESGLVYLCEGIATAASVWQAFPDQIAVCCGDASNMVAVCEEIRRLRPNMSIIACADNDWETEARIGKNAGLLAGRKCAELGAGLYYPVWGSTDHAGFSDFNDLHIHSGLDAVRACFGASAGSGEASVPEAPVVERGAGKPTKKRAFSDYQAAKLFLDSTEGDLIAQGKNFFCWSGKIWEPRQEPQDIYAIERAILKLHGNGMDDKQVKATMSMLHRIAPQLPAGLTLFEPANTAACFDDGTVYLKEGSQGMDLEFVSGHRREDYLCTSTPFDWEGDDSMENTLFREEFDKQFGTDPERDLIWQVFEDQSASFLLPRKPHLWFHFGESGRSKSTLTMAQMLIIDKRFLSCLDPSEMQGFLLEATIGKTVNINTDIDDRVAIASCVVKRLEDTSVPALVNRKGKPAAPARLPGIHVYCANKLPPLYERSSAMDRRFTTIEYRTDITRDKVRPNYENIIANGNYGGSQGAGDARRGLFNIAKRGLLRLAKEDFRFTVLQRSKDALAEWRDDFDPISQFLTAARSGELVTSDQMSLCVDMSDDSLRIERSRLFENFQNWHLKMFGKAWVRGPKPFYSSARIIFPELKNSLRYFVGIGVR